MIKIRTVKVGNIKLSHLEQLLLSIIIRESRIALPKDSVMITIAEVKLDTGTYSQFEIQNVGRALADEIKKAGWRNVQVNFNQKKMLTTILFNRKEDAMENKFAKGGDITYKGKAITKLFPSGYYEFYSDNQGRLVKYDSLKDAKAYIDEYETKKQDPNGLVAQLKKLSKDSGLPNEGWQPSPYYAEGGDITELEATISTLKEMLEDDPSDEGIKSQLKLLEEQKIAKLTPVKKTEPVQKPATTGLFSGAKVKPVTAKAAKDEKIVVQVPGLEPKLNQLQLLKGEIADLEAQLVAVTDEVKGIGKEKFVELYLQNHKNPDTFLIKDGNGCVMVLPTDKYISIKDEERANQLMSEYGKDVVVVDEKYYFNKDVLDRNKTAIEALIMNATTISTDDKANLLEKVVNYSVAKGFIDRLYSFGKRIENVIADVQPIFMLKNCGGAATMATGGDVGAGEFMLDVPVLLGYSSCHFTPMYGESDVCPVCGHDCFALTQQEVMNEIAEGGNEGYARGGTLHKNKNEAEQIWESLGGGERMDFLLKHNKQSTPATNEELHNKTYNFLPKKVKEIIQKVFNLPEEGSDAYEQRWEARKYARGGHVGVIPQDFEISMGDDVYYGNYHYEGVDLFMDSCEIMDENGNAVEVKDNATRLKVYAELERTTSIERETPDYGEEYATGGRIKKSPAEEVYDKFLKKLADADAEGWTDEEMYALLEALGYDYGKYGSKNYDHSGMAEMAINEGFRWDDKKKKWYKSGEEFATGGEVLTMDKQFVPYPLARTLKQLGFNEPCLAVWNFEDKGKERLVLMTFPKYQIDQSNHLIFAPTYQQVVDWFRVEKKLNLYLTENPYTQGNGGGLYEWHIKPVMVKNQPLPQPMGFGSGSGLEYYEAYKALVEAALNQMEKFAKGGSVKGNKWIQEALSGNKGALRATAKKQGILTQKHTKLNKTDLHKLEKEGGKTAKRAHLAETLSKFAEGGEIEVVGRGNKGAFRKREYAGMTEEEVVKFWTDRGYKPSKTKIETKLSPYTFFIEKYSEGGDVRVKDIEISFNRRGTDRIMIAELVSKEAKEKGNKKWQVVNHNEVLLPRESLQSFYDWANENNLTCATNVVIKKKFATGGTIKPQFKKGDMVWVDDSGYVTAFDGFDLSKPAKIIDISKEKTGGKTYVLYQLEMADGKKPFNKAMEKKLTLAE